MTAPAVTSEEAVVATEEKDKGTEKQRSELKVGKPPPPTLALPPRNPAEAFLKGSDAATPSPMTYVSSLFTDRDPFASSFSQLLAGAIASPSVISANVAAVAASVAYTENSSVPSSSTSTETTKLTEAGSTAAGSTSTVGSEKDEGRPSSARFKSMVPPRLPISRSHFFTIPPGLSPTTLLESPVLLSSGRAEPSPTTGTFQFPPLSQEHPKLSNDDKSDKDGSPSFVFKPHPQLPNSPLSSMGPFGLSHQQVLAEVQAQADSQTHLQSKVEASPDSSGADTAERDGGFESMTIPMNDPKVSSPSVGLVEHSEGPSADISERPVSSQIVVRTQPLPHLVERPQEDGYNWRKYGQKQVKGSEYPRSYYKCTHPNCPVKKKVERSYDGQITEIMYKGEHNHPKPQATRRSGMNHANPQGDGLARDDLHGQNRSPGDIARGLSGGMSGTPEPSLASTSDDDEVDGGDDALDSKRRKMEKYMDPIINTAHRTVREPRVVVQTISEVDILDDGYRWRKYGQKVVKGNPHPRSYYKCTNVGCPVRKHVERSATDEKSVITTYEGKHNHEVPVGRNSGHGAATASVSLSGGYDSGAPAPNKGAISLQEQLFGRLMEEGYNQGVPGMELANVGYMQRSVASDQAQGQGSIHDGSQVSSDMMGHTNVATLRPSGGDFMQQGLGLKPKEEPGESHYYNERLEPAHHPKHPS